MNMWLFLLLICGLLIAVVLVLFLPLPRFRTKVSTRADRQRTDAIFRDDDRYWYGGDCRLTHKFAKTGRYASEEENGEDMCQIQAPISFREFKKIVWERAIRNSAS